MSVDYDVAIVGAGPGGYVAAIRAAQMGKRVVLFERDRVGGTCMNRGCIPTKFLLHQTKIFQDIKGLKSLTGPFREIGLDWEGVQREKSRSVDRLVRGVEFLLEKNGVDLVRGDAVLKGEGRISLDGGGREISAQRIILAAGSRPAALPFLKADGERVLTSREALDLASPPESLLIIGAGAIGLEMGTIFQRLGTKVIVIELLPQILPGCDPDLAGRLERLLKRQGIQIHTAHRIESARIADRGVTLHGTCLSKDVPFELTGERALVAVGRRPVSELLENSDPGLELDRSGFVKVDERLETGIVGVYAIGDLIGGKLLAHKASHEGLAAVENAFGAGHRLNPDTVPAAVFTEPELAMVGLNEAEAKERFGSAQVGIFSLQASGRALTMGSTEGLVKVVADRNGRVCGGHILAPHASELIAELSLAVSRRLTLKDVSETIHIHPTLSESLGEAALKAQGRAIHVLNFP